MNSKLYILLNIRKQLEGTHTFPTSIISLNTPNQNFYIAIFFSVVRGSSKIIFENRPFPRALRTLILSFSAEYIRFLWRVWSYKLLRALIVLDIRSSTVLFQGQSDRKATRLPPLTLFSIITTKGNFEPQEN